MRRAVLIANPSASQFTGGVYRDVLNALSQTYDITTEWPVSGQGTFERTTNAVNDGIDAVFAMGGDGVAHHTANALVGSGTALGLIPVGTTNVLSRILGIDQRPVQAAVDAAAYAPAPTRMARLSAHTPDGPMTRHATFSIGVGFDADVVEAAERRPYAKLRFGGIYYASTAIGRLLSEWRGKLPDLRISADGVSADAVAALTQIHDPYTYFGRIPLHLTPDPPDGLATVAINKLGVANATGLVSRAVFNRDHTVSDDVTLWTEYQSLHIDAEPAVPLQADGELLGLVDSVTIEGIEEAMLVLRPNGRTDGDAG